MPDTKLLPALPTPIFGPAMGIQGLAVVARYTLGSGWLSLSLGAVSAAVLVLAVGAHVAKHVRHPARARADLRSSTLVAFHAQPAITLLLAAEVYDQEFPTAAAIVAAAGAVWALAALAAQIAAAARDDAPAVPPQLIPGIACLMLPLTAIHHLSSGFSWAAIGLGSAAIAAYYLRRGPTPLALPAQLAPTAVIALAPPAVLCLDIVALAPRSPLAFVPLGGVGFVALTLCARLPDLIRAPFGLAWWAYTMPVSATILAVVAVLPPDGPWRTIGYAGLAVNIFSVAAVSAGTARALFRGRLLPRSAPSLRPALSAAR